MDIAVSTSIGRAEPLSDLMRQIADSGFYCVELGYGHLETPEDVGPIVELAEGLNIEITTLHLPFSGLDISNPDESARREACDVLIKYVEQMGKHGLKMGVFHPNSYANASTEDELNVRNAFAVSSIKQIVDVAAREGVVLALENMPGRSDRLRNGRTTSELMEILDKVDSDHIGVCIDTLHAHMNHFPPHEEIAVAGSRLIALHASDSIDHGHNHLVPGLGELDWRKIAQALERVDYKGVFTMEVYGPRESTGRRDMPEVRDLINAAYSAGTVFQHERGADDEI